MSGPTTEAGKAHLEDWFDTVKDAWGPESVNREDMADTIAAIEAVAGSAERARIAGEYRKLRGYPASGPGSGDEVLAIIERRGRHWDGILR